ncbi:MAG: hypothetical protein N3A54_04075 [Patescibacteria group bacterium]|nr:hypothetical protein [Patescibacteria group bacterium]
MKYEYVDIGTSDFETSLDEAKATDKIILVEPLLHYLSKFPDRNNIYKCPFAITDIGESVRKLYYIPEFLIEQRGYPLWVKGCNKLDEPHPTLLKLGIPESDFAIANVPFISVGKFIEMYNIMEIGRLKIDTEGWEDKILLSFYNYQLFNMVKIDEIIFEYIWNKDALDEIVKKYKKYFQVKMEPMGDNIRLIIGERKF